MKRGTYITLTLIFATFVISVYTINIKDKNGNLNNDSKLQVMGFGNVANKSILGLGKAETFKSNQNPNEFKVKSIALRSGDIIPLIYVCDKINGGKNISIPIEWSNAPSGTKSFAVFMYDTSQASKKFVHWAVINIPLNVKKIIEGASASQYMPSISVELKNSAGNIGYIGPCPPAGTGKHEYKIIVYALNIETMNLSGFVSLNQFQSAIKRRVLSQSEMSVFFKQ